MGKYISGFSNDRLKDSLENRSQDIDAILNSISGDGSGLTNVTDEETAASLTYHIGNTDNPHETDLNTLKTGTLSELNSVVTDATLDDIGDKRVPTIHDNMAHDPDFATGLDLTTHTDDETNPHNTSINNIVAGTLSELNNNLTDATLVNEADIKTELSELDDVDNIDKAAGKILEVDTDGVTHKYVDPPSEIASINDIGDVDTAGVEDEQALLYDLETGTWVPGEVGGSYDIYVTDVTIGPDESETVTHNLNTITPTVVTYSDTEVPYSIVDVPTTIIDNNNIRLDVSEDTYIGKVKVSK